MLLNLAKLRADIGWSASRDAELVELINQVESMLAEETDRNWELKTDFVETHRLENQETVIRLKTYPIEEIRVIEWENDTEEPDWDLDDDELDLLVEDVDFYLTRESGCLVLTQHRNRIQVELTGGYITTTLPYMVHSALHAQVKYMAGTELAENIGVKTKQVTGVGSTTFKDDKYHPRFEEVIHKYRRTTFG